MKAPKVRHHVLPFPDDIRSFHPGGMTANSRGLSEGIPTVFDFNRPAPRRGASKRRFYQESSGNGISLARRARFNVPYPPSTVSVCHKVHVILGSGMNYGGSYRFFSYLHICISQEYIELPSNTKSKKNAAASTVILGTLNKLSRVRFGVRFEGWVRQERRQSQSDTDDLTASGGS